MLDSISLRLLRSFSEFGQETLDLYALFEVGGSEPTKREAVLDAVARLVHDGLLEERSNDFYALTNAGKQAAASGRMSKPSKPK